MRKEVVLACVQEGGHCQEEAEDIDGAGDDDDLRLVPPPPPVLLVKKSEARASFFPIAAPTISTAASLRSTSRGSIMANLNRAELSELQWRLLKGAREDGCRCFV